MTALDESTSTGVVLGGRRGGPDVKTLRTDNWWMLPGVTVAFLMAFVVYATYAAFIGKNFFYEPHNLLSPFYSPCFGEKCVTNGVAATSAFSFWHLSPAFLILIFPLGFRFTCYYYRKAYYRSFWRSPAACGVQDGHKSYSGETKLPLIMQNIHRYFFFIGLIFNLLLTVDAVQAFIWPGGGFHASVGTLVLLTNATLLWLYSLSCHACRHLCGGQVRSFSKHPLRYKFWKFVTPLNGKHMMFAWISLGFVAFTDFYVRMVASGTITDFKFF